MGTMLMLVKILLLEVCGTYTRGVRLGCRNVPLFTHAELIDQAVSCKCMLRSFINSKKG
jgi:hypothetical protein